LILGDRIERHGTSGKVITLWVSDAVGGLGYGENEPTR
jgi:hypothetical protein